MYTIYALEHHDAIIYVGCTKRTLQQRFREHFTPTSNNRLVREYLDTHGREKNDYSIQTLLYHDCPDNVKKIEAYFVQYFKPSCNYTKTGQGGYRKSDPRISGDNALMKNPEVIAKVSAALTGEKNPNYGRTGEKNPFFGKKHTTESRSKMSASLKGRTAHNRYNHVWDNSHEIARLHKTGKWTYRQLAKKFSCGKSTIHKVLKAHREGIL